MGVYSEYLTKSMNFDTLCVERKKQLKRISKIRGDRDILVYASDQMKNAPTQIDYSDLMPFYDQLANLTGKHIDIILETPGGFAEVVEDMVKILRAKYEKVGIIIPGYCKSAGTIFAMAGDEILMGPMSALGPIDAQIRSNSKGFSAEAFLEGLNKIKAEVISSGKLNPAYIPILQNISPGEIQHCENAQNFSQKLVSEWLARYKFKFWETHSSSGVPVTEDEKKSRAEEIANILCKQSKWLTHGRSIKRDDLEKMKLHITDYSIDQELNDAIVRYYTLLRMSFDTNLYKILETTDSQIYKFVALPGNIPAPFMNQPQNENTATLDFECPKCKTHSLIQMNLGKSIPLKPNHQPYPVGKDVFVCKNCKTEHNLSTLRLRVEAQTGKKIVK
ncbi:MAG: Clp protease ClpP [Fibrobacter sp.]|nr:Clp protease ClpP [Fibrobacter sp.]